MKNIISNCVPYKDMFNYYNLITKIDPGYKLVFNQRDKLFMVINSAKNNQICLKFSMFSFDLFKKLQMSRIENSKYLFQKIDNYNQSLEQKKIKKLKDNVTVKSFDLINYSKRTSSITKKDIKKIIEE